MSQSLVLAITPSFLLCELEILKVSDKVHRARCHTQVIWRFSIPPRHVFRTMYKKKGVLGKQLLIPTCRLSVCVLNGGSRRWLGCVDSWLSATR